jgi:cation diffusion facilitator family transporter
MKEETLRLGYLEGWISTVLNVVLFIFKMWVGIISGSIAMISDSWHTLSDSLTSIVVIIGFWISSRPSDEEHPFGHGRAETIASVVIATLLLVVGFNFMVESFRRLQHHQAATFATFPIVVFIISVVLKEALALFSFWAGKKVHANSLIADGWHHRSDAIASGLIVVGAVTGKHYWWTDGVMGLAVSGLIIWAAFSILKEATNLLMGSEAPPELKNNLKALIEKVAPGQGDYHHLHIHHYGEHEEVTLHIRMPANTPLHQAHSTGQKIEETIRKELGIEATIHVEPEKKVN